MFSVAGGKMNEIRGDSKNILTLLAGSKFSVDYYQREYRWGKKQVTELLDDLDKRFCEFYDHEHEREAVKEYGHYFLGSIIISDSGQKKFVIDGQQRLTSLSLILIHIHRQLAEADHKSEIAKLICSTQYGKRSFNLDVPERVPCMDALFAGQEYNEDSQPESVVNLLARFRDIEDNFPEGIKGRALSNFADWLIHKVYLVEITAYSDEDAYTIFETMNDRGLSLTPTDMLKGFLLTNIGDTELRKNASHIWRRNIESLQELGKEKKEEDADAIKSWLRSQYAESIRQPKLGAKAEDFNLLGTEFHRWVRDHQVALGLKTAKNFSDFICNDFRFYSNWYRKIRQMADKLTYALGKGTEAIHFNANSNFTLQYPVLLAPLRTSDSEDEIHSKLRIVATYLDILIARRVWCGDSISYSTMQYAMFLVIRDIRGKSSADLIASLTERLYGEKDFSSKSDFQLHGRNRKHVHRILARMIHHVETKSGQESRYSEYMQRGGKKGYEIEHIWANKPERHKQEFPHDADFREYRNRIGGLLLLPKSFNASYGDLPYSEKYPHYFGQNLLAQSLNKKAYEKNPGFKVFREKFQENTGAVFQPHKIFGKEAFDNRQELYLKLAEEIWNPSRLMEVTTSAQE